MQSTQSNLNQIKPTKTTQQIPINWIALHADTRIKLRDAAGAIHLSAMMTIAMRHINQINRAVATFGHIFYCSFHSLRSSGLRERGKRGRGKESGSRIFWLLIPSTEYVYSSCLSCHYHHVVNWLKTRINLSHKYHQCLNCLIRQRVVCRSKIESFGFHSTASKTWKNMICGIIGPNPFSCCRWNRWEVSMDGMQRFQAIWVQHCCCHCLFRLWMIFLIHHSHLWKIKKKKINEFFSS